MFKRLFDIIVSFTGLLIISPVLLTIALYIKAGGGGPVFYRGLRVGKNGRIFSIYKFRTMVVDAEKIGGVSTADDDPRITIVGKFLRTYKLDELPQLINVLKGEMSIVGPRPEVPSEVETYTDEEKRVLDVQPGITDWASLTFHNEGEILRGSIDPHQTYREKIKPEKMKLAMRYVDNRSFFTDIHIILQTIAMLVKSRT